MNQTTKRQFVLSIAVLFLFITTMFFWYDHFIFHTYIEPVDYQYTFSGMNDDIMIQNYEFYQNQNENYVGNARLLSFEDQFFLKNDQIQCLISYIDSSNHLHTYQHQFTIQSDSRVCFLDKQIFDSIDNIDIQQIEMQLQILRNKEKIYDEKILLNQDDLNVYRGGNKDYTIENVYVTSKWLKTGQFLFTESDIINQYQYYTIDYLILKDNGQKENLDDYERVIHIVQDLSSYNDYEIQEVYFEDGNESLLNKEIMCVVSIYKDQQDESPMTFSIELNRLFEGGTLDE